MSWWIYLQNPKTKESAEVECHREGGTYAISGVDEAELNVTYNYSNLFYFKDLHKKKAGDTIPILEKKVNELGTKRDNDYWKSTKGNVGYACSVLLKWAKQYPEYIWEVS